jgi:hypothetical protein
LFYLYQKYLIVDPNLTGFKNLLGLIHNVFGSKKPLNSIGKIQKKAHFVKNGLFSCDLYGTNFNIFYG